MDEVKTDEAKSGIYVSDLVEAFGEILELTYNFEDGTLWISWVIIKDEMVDEIRVESTISESNRPEVMEDFLSLEIEDMSKNVIFFTDQFRQNADFIGK